MSYLGTFLYVFFTPRDIGRKNVLGINMGFRIVFLAIYLFTVVRLHRKFHYFPKGVMDSEVKSIKRQFLAFLVGFLAQFAFFIAEMVDDRPSIVFEATSTVVFLVSFLGPIQVILWAHYQTFKGFDDAEEEKEVRDQPTGSVVHDSVRAQANVSTAPADDSEN